MTVSQKTKWIRGSLVEQKGVRNFFNLLPYILVHKERYTGYILKKGSNWGNSNGPKSEKPLCCSTCNGSVPVCNGPTYLHLVLAVLRYPPNDTKTHFRNIHFIGHWYIHFTPTMDSTHDAAASSSMPSEPNLDQRKKNIAVSNLPATSMPGVARVTTDSAPEENQAKGRM